MMRAVGVALLFLSMGAALAGPAAAHDRRVTAGEVRLDGDRIQVRYRVRRVDVTSLGPDAAQWAHHLRGAPPPEVSATLTPLYGAAGCVPEASSFARVAGGDASEVRFAWSLRCEDPPAALRIRPFPAPGHLHVVTLVQEGGSTRLLVSERARDLPLLNSAPAAVASASAYLGHGFEHAISGWDHVLFVLLLVLLAPRLRDAAFVVTGFTLGHSLTLALAALGWVDVDGRAVEVLIAASIVGMAAENVGRVTASRHASYITAVLAVLLGLVSGTPALVPVALMIVLAAHVTAEARSALRARFALAACFGMIHGLGFSTGLDAGGQGVVPRLLAFNIGVELAQLVVVFIVLGLMQAARVRDDDAAHKPRRVVMTSTGIAAAGAFTTVLRALE